MSARRRWLVGVLAVLTAAAGCGEKDEPAPAKAATAETLTITWTGPTVGLVQTTHEQSRQDLTLQAGAAAPERIQVERQIEKRTEVLEVAATFKRKVKVRYQRAHESQTAGGETVERDLAVAGKSYLVTLGDGLIATTDAGAAISEDELAVLREDVEDELGRVPGMAKIMLDRAWLRGEPVTMGPEQVAMVAADMPPGTKVNALTVTWVRSDDGVARFALEVDAVGVGGMKMPIDAALAIEVAHARPVEITGTAALSGSSDGGTITGTISTRVVNTYVEPAR